MSEKRLEKRNKKRLPVKFGYDKLDYIGYLTDVSSQGFFVESRIVYKPGVVLNFEITTRNGAIILVEGRVQWAKKGALRVNHIMKSGMGIYILKFMQGKNEYQALNDLQMASLPCS